MRRTVLSILLFVCSASALYHPVREYAGPTFFDGWAYYGNVDNTTWGNVTYVDKETAMKSSLTYVNTAGNAVVRVDNFTVIQPAPLVNRDTIRLTSLDSYGIGSLIIIDAAHIPYGCSVWPAFWTYGIEQEWPLAGEIDIIEAINGMDHNQFALHTTPGCFKADEIPGTQTGQTLEGDCSTPRGCIVAETKPNSFGPAFAAAGGGVYAVQIAESGVFQWFWSRPDIPANLLATTADNTLDISSWGIPTSAYPSTRCNMTQFFPPQNLVLLTTLCGVWAGVPSIYSSTCHTPTNNCVNDNIVGDGSNYANAYWEIKSIRAFISDDAPIQPPSSATPTPNSPITTVTGSQSPPISSVAVSVVVISPTDTPSTDTAQPTASPTGKPSSATIPSPNLSTIFHLVLTPLILVLF